MASKRATRITGCRVSISILPLGQWRTVATNVPGANGTFTFIGTNVFAPGNPRQFYILGNTNYNP